MLKASVKDIVIFVLIIAVVVVGTIITTHRRKTEEANRIVGVHIKGEINNPGYYELKFGSRLNDVIKKAGGLTDDADVDRINLAEKLIDGIEIIIPSKWDEETVSEASQNGDAVNINTAGILDLCEVNGIGESTAKAIIKYREEHGNFVSVEDIKNVNGIGESKFESIKSEITV